MPWQELVFETQDTDAEDYSERLTEAGALAITLADGQNQAIYEPKPNETPLWSLVRLSALFEVDQDLTDLHNSLAAESLIHGLKLNYIEDQDWQNIWLKDFKPLHFGRLWICASHQEPPEQNAICLKIDPGLAFGTGAEITTSLCLQWLDQSLTAGIRLLDYGCGSGILALAALKLGASFACAVDYDPQAIMSTRLNAEKNNISSQQLWLGSPENFKIEHFKQKPLFDVVIANIVADTLIELLPILNQSLAINGYLVLSGILASQAQRVMDCYETVADLLESTSQGEWLRLVYRRKG